MRKKKLLTILTILITLLVSVLIPLSMTNGTENYQGQEKEFAERTMQFIDYDIKSQARDAIFYRFMKIRIEKILYTPKICGFSKYSAVLSYRTLFGIKIEEHRVSGCQMDGDQGNFNF